MSKDFFRVKKGLNIKPTDPTTVTDLEDGDIIVDSTDNQLKKYSEEDGEFSTIAGSGGTVANFFSDFDKLTPTVSNATVADDSVTFLPIDDNNKSKKATFSAAGSVLYEVASEADLEGNQGLMTVWIKTSLNSVTISTTTDGAVQSTLSVIGTNKWKQYEIPFVVGGTDQGFIVEAGEAGDVFIDEPFVGLAPAGYVSKIATTITDWVSYTPEFNTRNNDASIGNGVSVGTYRRVGDTLELNFQFTFGSTTNFGSGDFVIKIPDGLSIDDSKLTSQEDNFPCGLYLRDQSVLENRKMSATCIKTPGANNSILFVHNTGSGDDGVNATTPFTWASTDRINGKIVGIPIQGWSTDYSTVVTQNTELTAQTANEFSAKINSDGTVISQNYDWINGNCTKSEVVHNGEDLNKYVCNFNNEIFSNEPSCVASNDVDLLRGITVDTTATSVNFLTYALTSTYPPTPTNTSFQVQCSKQGADVNKSATIIGKFENINSSELVQVIARKTTGQTLTNNTLTTINYDDKELDNYSAYNSTTGVFTCPKTSNYLVNYNIFFAQLDDGSTSVQLSRIRHNGQDYEIFRNEGLGTGSDDFNASGSKVIMCKKDETIEVIGLCDDKDNTNCITRPSDSVYYNHLSITELPDTSSIIKNLLAESSQTKCQTKKLSSAANSNGTISELSFSNLVVGKKYSIGGQVLLRPTTDLTMEILDNVTRIGRVRQSTDGDTTVFGLNLQYTATSQSLNIAHAGSGTIESVGNNQGTFITLCQLPDTYVDTDEW